MQLNALILIFLLLLLLLNVFDDVLESTFDRLIMGALEATIPSQHEATESSFTVLLAWCL